MQISWLGSSEKVDRIDRGKGIVREHSIDIGDTVIVFNNIGTITVIDGRKSPLPLFVGIALTLFGLFSFASRGSVKTFAFMLLLAGAALTYWAVTRQPDRFLSIGTSDGRRTNIVSKDRKFLEDVREFLREKLDKNVFRQATIDVSSGKIVISANTISGGMAFGASATATGTSAPSDNLRQPQ